MSLTKTLFVAIDKLFNRPQNPKKMERALSSVTAVQDVAYSADYPDMRLDVNFLPRSDGSRYPVIMVIHGGGFSAGDKKYRRVLSKYFAKHTGAFVVNVNYGVGRTNAFPLPLRHLVAAANWVCDNTETYNLDLSHFAVFGDSAGAYYAAFLCALQDNPALQEQFGCSLNARFTAGIFNCGPYDFRKMMDKSTGLHRGICKEFTGLTLKQARAEGLFDKLSVTNYVIAAFPPCFVVHARHDVFCKGQAELLLAALHQHNVSVESIGSTKLTDNHDYNLTWKSKMAVLTNAKMINFLNTHFYGEATPRPDEIPTHEPSQTPIL